MSETKTEMTGEEAWSVLHNQVYAPTVFAKLAHQYGIVPANPTEAEALLRLGQKLRTLYDAGQAKQAARQNVDLLSRAEQLLDAELAKQAGVTDPDAPILAKYACDLAKSETLAAAAHAYLAEVAKQRLAQQSA